MSGTPFKNTRRRDLTRDGTGERTREPVRADRCRDRYSRWYGGEICVTLDREGAGVVAADLDRDGLAAVEERVRNVGCDCDTVVCDVSDQNECRALRDRALDAFDWSGPPLSRMFEKEYGEDINFFG